MFICRHCNDEKKNANSLRNHERLCKNNSQRKIASKTKAWYDAMHARKGRGTNQWTKAKETGIPYILKEETRKKLSEQSSKASKEYWLKEENRKKQSESMKKAVEKYPDSYTASNRGRTKQIIVDGIKFQGKWELEFYQYCKNNKIQITRSNEWFEYQWNGTRKYFPDFYLCDHNLYVEIKGYETDRDRAKWNSFPKQLRVIRKNDIMAIRKGNWALS